MDESTLEGPTETSAVQVNLPRTLWSELWSRIVNRLSLVFGTMNIK